jgi:hypothetical protein
MKYIYIYIVCVYVYHFAAVRNSTFHPSISSLKKKKRTHAQEKNEEHEHILKKNDTRNLNALVFGREFAKKDKQQLYVQAPLTE